MVMPLDPPPQLWYDKKPVQIGLAVGVPLVIGTVLWAALRR